MQSIQFFWSGIEYTTRFDLAQKYPLLSHNKLQRFLEREDLAKISYKNLFFYEKDRTEQALENLLKK